MTGRYALLLDGGFVEKRLASRNRRPPDPADILAECARIRAHPRLAGSALLRVYYYDAPPATGSTRHPCTGRQVILELTDTHRRRARFLDELELCPDIALRLGEVAMRGWRVRRGAIAQMAAQSRPLQEDDVELHLEQKGVDLRLGLDIARLALRQLVDTLVVVTGDSDMIPAFKFARREGLRVLLTTSAARSAASCAPTRISCCSPAPAPPSAGMRATTQLLRSTGEVDLARLRSDLQRSPE